MTQGHVTVSSFTQEELAVVNKIVEGLGGLNALSRVLVTVRQRDLWGPGGVK